MIRPLASIAIFFIAMEASGRIMLFNRGAEEITRYARADATGGRTAFLGC